MDLALDIFQASGRKAKPASAVVLRPLERADLEMRAAAEVGVKPSAVKRISERHHAVARSLALGMPEAQVAAATGYSLSRISILKADPSFQELMKFYRESAGETFADMQQKLAGITSTALDILADRLEDEPEKFKTGDLLEVLKAGADRSGYGPKTTQTNVNVNLNLSDRLQAARKRVEERNKLLELEIAPPEAAE